MFAENRLELVSQLEARLGVTFNRRELLLEALIHPSCVGEGDLHRLQSNQRLEFLGDSVIGIIVSEVLFLRHPELSEGDLTKIKAAAVSEGALARAARQLELGDFLVLGKGEAGSGGRARPSILADAFEALVGALFLERGLPAAQAFVLAALAEEISAGEEHRSVTDAKSRLQEFVQSQGQGTPTYHVVETSGPDHKKWFTVEVRIRLAGLGCGAGASKKEAEQAAAAVALVNLQTSEPVEGKPKRKRRRPDDAAVEVTSAA